MRASSRWALASGRVSTEYAGWGITYPYFPGMFFIQGAAVDVGGLSAPVVVNLLVPVLGGLVALPVFAPPAPAPPPRARAPRGPPRHRVAPPLRQGPSGLPGASPRRPRRARARRDPPSLPVLLPLLGGRGPVRPRDEPA